MDKRQITLGLFVAGAVILSPSFISHDKKELTISPKEKTVLVLSKNNTLSTLLENKNDEKRTNLYLNHQPYSDKWNLRLIEKLNPSLCIQVEKNKIPEEGNSFTIYYASTNKQEKQSFDIACKVANEIHKRGFTPYMNSGYMQNTCPTGEIISDFINHPVLENASTPSIILEYHTKSGLKEREIMDAIDNAVKKYFEEKPPQGYPMGFLLVW